MPVTDEERQELEQLTEQRRAGLDQPDEPVAPDWIKRASELRRKAAAERPAADVLAEIQAQRERDKIEAREQEWGYTMPARFAGAHVEQLAGPVRALADEWDGVRNVLLLGGVGVGKTHAAVAIARTAHRQGSSVMFRSSTHLLDELRPDGDDRAMERAVNAGVLVLDDLGAERPTDWTAERLRLLVDRRYNAMRPTVVTSNLDPKALEAAVGERMWSRLYEGALRLTVAGEDRRRAS